MALIMAVFFNPPIGIAAAIRDIICFIFFAIGVVMGLHLALAPHEFAVQINVCVACIIPRFSAEAKYLRAGSLVSGGSNCAVIDIDCVLASAFVALIDIQCLFIKRCRVHRTVIEIDGIIPLIRLKV